MKKDRTKIKHIMTNKGLEKLPTPEKWTKEYRQEYNKQWKKDNPEKVKESDRRWRERNKEYIKNYKIQYRIRKKKENRDCLICGKLVNQKPNKFCCQECYWETLKCKRPIMAGENHPNWKGGISLMRPTLMSTFKYRGWRRAVFERDYYTCQECKKKKEVSGKLIVHHIEAFEGILKKYHITAPEEAIKCGELWNVKNGITLCEKCHKEKHKHIKKLK